MRKVSRQIKEAFEAGKSRTIGNTSTNGESVFLHGNQIVKREAGKVYWTLAGWNTATTRERVNSIVNAGVYQKDFEPYVDGKEVCPHTWYAITE